jgi:formylglycine-generating enzyme required for sulfatase activity
MKHGEQVGFSNRSSNSVTHLHSRTRGSCDEPSTEDLKKQAAPHFACDGFYIGDFCQSRATGLPEKSAVVDTPTVTSPNATQNPEEDSKVKPVGSVNPSMLKGEGYEAIKIVKGTFDIGCTPEEKRIQDCYKYEMPSHKVTITNDFYMMKSEVTQGLYEKVMGSNPSYFNSCGSDCPVENVTWYGAIKFANALSKKEGLEQCYSISGEGTASVNVSWSKGVTCTGWRLPTEAEWEYAARGGEKHSYSGSNNPDEVAWSGQNNSDDTTHLVCGKKTNGYGLCDMSGNVWEWCWDWFELYDSTSKTDPIGPDEAMWLPSGPQRLKRGGSYGFPVWHTRVSNRYGAEPSIYYPHLGFRLIISTS